MGIYVLRLLFFAAFVTAILGCGLLIAYKRTGEGKVEGANIALLGWICIVAAVFCGAICLVALP